MEEKERGIKIAVVGAPKANVAEDFELTLTRNHYETIAKSGQESRRERRAKERKSKKK